MKHFYKTTDIINLTRDVTQEQTMEERFEDRFPNTLEEVITDSGYKVNIKQFISSEIDKAIAGERERIVEMIEEKLNDGYEILYTNGGQIFPKAGWYMEKSNNGKVEDIFYLSNLIQNKSVDNSNDKSTK